MARDGGLEPDLGRRVAVVSPHLDDAVLSLGASIAGARRAGSAVTVVTVFAGDPGSTDPVDDWGRRCGFATTGEMYRARRGEDRAALASLAADRVWLPLDVDSPDAEIALAVDAAIEDADSVLIPGSPCTHPDHLRVARLVLARRPRGRVGLYVDQPYAMWRLLGTPVLAGRGRRANLATLALRLPARRRLQAPRLAPELAEWVERVEWQVVRARRREVAAKVRALYRYRSQLRGFGRVTVPGILLYEAAAGGEQIGWAAE